MAKLTILLLGFLIALPIHNTRFESTDDPRIGYIQKFNIPEAKLIYTQVAESVQTGFPSTTDVLAIAAIESSFNHKVNKAGLMQVMYKKTSSMKHNIQTGIMLLRDYHRRLGSEKAAIHAYNVGIGAYRSGVRNDAYYKKYIKEKSKIEIHFV